MAKSEKPKPKRRSPLWARLCAILGCVLMVLSGGALITSQALVARYAGAVKTENLFEPPAEGEKKEPVSDIKGPVNILLVGIDPRDENSAPLSDSIIVVHIPEGLRQAYLFSIPRDLRVEIPPFAKTGFQGANDRVNAAMSYGSRLGNGKYDAAQGFALLAKTIAKLTGIKKFDAGAIINFNGFKEIVDAMGGVTMTIDQNVKSEHLKPNGKPRDRRPECADHSCEHPYVGPQAEYKKGTYHLEGWQALDYVRQRYGLPRVDYDRQRHQQQFIKAMAEQALSKDVVTNPIKLDQVLRAAGDALVFDGNGHTVVDWGLALRNLRSDDMTLVKLPAGAANGGGTYIGEALEPAADDFFASLRDGTVASFLVDNPSFLQKL
ncbi:LCP family protein [Couchioplanes caeruleus]|uniref:Transcriptional regulator n=2 Tax=Couchioplanes caeruleus TaxID=56438 RepID=A0A1K0GUM1_9ACTN|nr:transcriptional regulator [Couchioplanes caeruleus subsp. caeruleus]ROP32335.1 LytR family transcriptional attenuator [Couchioplanes caeruleus]